MKILEGNIEDISISEKINIALGAFDGIHLGHKKIIKFVVDNAKKTDYKSAVFTFKEHPSKVINKNNEVKILTNNDIKARIIEEMGVDYLILVSFDKKFADIEPKEFIQILVNKLNVNFICCGYNYTFGKAGAGNTLLLDYYKDIYNYGLKVIEKVSYNDIKISSTVIRKKIEQGKIYDANILLGYNYFCIGEVKMGKQLGRKVLFPTANIDIDSNLCLKNGVYITITDIDGVLYPSISNVGYNPTVNGIDRKLETHIINYDKNLYGKKIKVELIYFIRSEMKFNSVEELKEQIQNDINTAKKYFTSFNS